MNSLFDKKEPDKKVLEQLAREHDAWLLLPTTQLALSILLKRKKSFEETLQSDVLKETNEKRQEQLRQCIKTTKTLFDIISNTNLFVSFSVQTIDDN